MYLSEIFGAIDRSWTESTDTVHKNKCIIFL
jgi:hypothetical protein